jgi:hypothetical protein
MMKMSTKDYSSMSTQELWQLHQKIAKLLAHQLRARRRQLDRLLARLGHQHATERRSVSRRGSRPRRGAPAAKSDRSRPAQQL